MKLLSAASTCFWCTLVLLWWYAIHPQWFKDCPGPILKPAPRPESWCVSYNKKLNKEVALADANKVSLPSSTSAYHSMDAFSRWQALQGALGVVCPSLESPGVARSASRRKPSLQHPLAIMQQGVTQVGDAHHLWCLCFILSIAHILLQGFELVFYGDSITETWRGTDMGRPCGRCARVPAIFETYFGSKYDSEVLAVGGRHPLPCS